MLRRFSFQTLLMGALGALLGAVLTGLALRWSSQWVLMLHLVVGFLGIAPVAVFLARHWWARRHTVGQRRNSRWGYLALVCLVVLLATGIALIFWTNIAPLQWLHWGAMVVLVIDLAFHMAWRIRRTAHTVRVSPRFVAGTAVVLLAVGAGIWTVRVIASPVDSTANRVAIAHKSLGQHLMADARNCASCHSDIADQWRMSAHSRAATDEYYQALAAMFIQERGIEAGRYCATCHNPIGLMQGEIAVDAPKSTDASDTAYDARALGVALPMSERAAEGVSCVICHLAATAAEQPTNGSLDLYAAGWVLPTNPAARLALRAAPAQHERALMPAVIVSAQMCGSCHNLQLPNNGMKLEPTFDEWLASPYPQQNKTCQSCHMPATSGQRVDSGMTASVRAHGGAPGAPSTLPSLSDDPRLLRSAATLTVTGTFDERVRLTVRVTNSGAGHALPTGADDLRQVWLETTVRDAVGTTLWEGGVFDDYGDLPPDTPMFRKVLGDRDGNPIDLHRFWETTQILEDTRLMPLETRDVPYEIRLPDGVAPSSVTVTTRLLYRDVSQRFAEFALNRPAPDLPVQEMQSASVALVRSSR